MELILKKICLFAGTGILAGTLTSCGAKTDFAGEEKRKKGVQEEGVRPNSDALPERTPTFREQSWDFAVSVPIWKREKIEIGIRKSEVSLTSSQVTEPYLLTDTQVDRPKRSELFEQGGPGLQINEVFQQESLGKLDLLVVVDNSPSMKEEQTELSRRLSSLLRHIDQSDWRINLVSTSPSQNPQTPNCFPQNLILKQDPQAERHFSQAVLGFGIRGNGNEQGVKMGVIGLDCKIQGSQWTRKDSTVAVLIVSDEDNCSDGRGCGNDPWGKPEYLLNYLQNDLGKTLGKDARIYGIICIPGAPCDPQTTPGQQYQDMINKTTGRSGSIGDVSYETILQGISQDIRTILKTTFTLKAMPDPGTIKVFVEGTETLDFTAAGNVITFMTPPPYGANIRVTYASGAKPMVRSFKLSGTPVSATLDVTFSDAAVPPNMYQYLATENTLEFFADPPEKSLIKVVYREPLEMKSSWKVDPKVIPQSLVLSVNKTPTPFSLENNTVTVATPPQDGASVTISGEVLKGYTNEFDLPQLEDVTAYGLWRVLNAEGIEAPFVLENASITLPTIKPLETFTLHRLEPMEHGGSFSSLGFKTGKVLLPSLRLEADPSCAFEWMTGPNLNVNEGLYVTCLDPNVLDVTILFQEWKENQTIFEIDSKAAPFNPEEGTWKVYIDSDLTTEFERSGTRFTVKKALKPHQFITVTHATTLNLESN